MSWIDCAIASTRELNRSIPEKMASAESSIAEKLEVIAKPRS